MTSHVGVSVCVRCGEPVTTQSNETADLAYGSDVTGEAMGGMSFVVTNHPCGHTMVTVDPRQALTQAADPAQAAQPAQPA